MYEFIAVAGAGRGCRDDLLATLGHMHDRKVSLQLSDRLRHCF